MSVRIGLYVGHDYLAALVLGRRGIDWSRTLERGSDGTIQEQLRAILLEVPRQRRIRTSVWVAVGPTMAQVKCLRSLPPLASPESVRQLVEGAPAKYFVATGTDASVTAPMRDPQGWWVAVASGDLIGAIGETCAKCGFRIGGVRPIAAVLAHALATPHAAATIPWIDGGLSLEVTAMNTTPVAANYRAAQQDERIAVPALNPALQGLGTDAWMLAGAFAAARAGHLAPLQFRYATDVRSRTKQRMFRAAAIGLVALAMGAAMAGPGLAANRERDRSEAALRQLSGSASVALAERSALDRRRATLKQLHAFAASRRSVTSFLSALTMELPDSTAIVTLRLDTLGGTVVLLSPPAAAVLASVSAAPGVVGLQLTAPITREAVGPLELRRMALRFKFSRAPATPGKVAP